MQEKKLAEISTAELKIAVYDLMEELEKNSNAVKVIKQELARRKAIKETKTMEEETNVESGGVHNTEEVTEETAE